MHHFSNEPLGIEPPELRPGLEVVHASEGVISVEHDGTITWDDLQAIKAHYWSEACEAVELYPAASRVYNKCNMRHLWKVPKGTLLPDMCEDGWRTLV